MGIKTGERFPILTYNRVEWMEINAGAAKGGQIRVPVIFRLAVPEIKYIVNHSGCKGFLVGKGFVQLVNSMRDKLPTIPKENYVY